MLEGKDYKSIRLVFPFIAAYIGIETDCVEQALATTVHTAHFNLLCALTSDKAAAVDSGGYGSKTENHIQCLKQTGKKLFGTFENKNHFTLKFHTWSTLLKTISNSKTFRSRTHHHLSISSILSTTSFLLFQAAIHFSGVKPYK